MPSKVVVGGALSMGGFITPMAMLAAVFLFIIGAGLLSLGFNRRLYSIRSNHQLAARSAADYGLTEAVHQMNLRLLAGLNPPLPAKNSEPVPGSHATYSYTVTKNGGTYSVRAWGTSGSITKTVLCNLRLKSAFEYAILTKDTLDIGSLSKVGCDNCPEDNKLKIGTTNNPNADAEIILNPNAVVDGDILLGQGGTPSLVIGPGATYGNIYAVATDFDLPTPTVPSYLASAPDGGSKSDPATITSGKYQNLTLGNSKTLNITGNVELYITGDITLRKSAEIILDPDAKLTIYLAGSLEGKNSAGFNNKTNDPTKLAIYGLSSGDINIKNSGDFRGIIYAPDADVDIYAKDKVFGSVIANKYTQASKVEFQYDANLRKVTESDKLVRFVPTYWQEL